ncbi:hypothetical protein JXA27_08045 [Aerococcaceae bacterium zg-B36]|uniref:hypothetical protein n=1 Tax=Aerococcaceae bacterium zg-252 TaxID=2796928 RepID=UPI001BD903ED|nr:hypothetical protein [Aerococcaceae bacterium zg-B36]
MFEERLNKQEYGYLKQYGTNLSYVARFFERDSEYFVEFEDYEMFSIHLLFDIVHYGMDNQDTVNDIGIELYAIHDRICY